jgi:streptogrisin C
VCRSGIATGWRCGTIQAKNVTINVPGGRVFGLTRTSACAADGDSGGPFLAGQQAQGMLVASSGNCGSGGTSYFQRLVPVLSSYGLRLLTSGSGTTPPVVVSLNCDYLGNRQFQCLVGYYHPDGALTEWSVNGADRPGWDGKSTVLGTCGTGSRMTIEVTVSNSSGSDSLSDFVICEGESQ